LSTKILELDQIIIVDCEQKEDIPINFNHWLISAACFASLWQRLWLCCYGISGVDSLPVFSW